MLCFYHATAVLRYRLFQSGVGGHRASDYRSDFIITVLQGGVQAEKSKSLCRIKTLYKYTLHPAEG